MCPSPSPRLSSNRTILCGGNSISLNVDLMGEAVQTSGLGGGDLSICRLPFWPQSGRMSHLFPVLSEGRETISIQSQGALDVAGSLKTFSKSCFSKVQMITVHYG